ncbi:MAG: hypothetical protein EGS42_08090 [Coprococcus eutactus]|nr:hypothetical protein [Coprococcus eutactus]
MKIVKYRYLSKAKTCNEKWVSGFLHCKENKWYISNKAGSPFAFEVRPDTICQCTGLTDKNGNLIWENDIVKDLFSDACAQIKYGSYQSCFDSTKTEHVGFYVDWSGKCTKRYRKDLGYWINMVNAEVIGNIFDNPELIKESDT